MKDGSLTLPLIDCSSSYPPESSSSDCPSGFSAVGGSDLEVGKKFSVGSDECKQGPSPSPAVPLSPIGQGCVAGLGSFAGGGGGGPDSSPSGGGSSGYRAGLSGLSSLSLSSSVTTASLIVDHSSSFSTSGMGPPSSHGDPSFTLSSEHSDLSQSARSSHGGFHPSLTTDSKQATPPTNHLGSADPVPFVDKVVLGGDPLRSDSDAKRGRNKNNNNGNGSQTKDGGKGQAEGGGSGNVAATEATDNNEQLPSAMVPLAVPAEREMEENSSCVLVINEETLGDREMEEDTPTQSQQPFDLPHCRESVLAVNVSPKACEDDDDDEDVMIVDGSKHSPAAETLGSTQPDFHLHFSPSQSQSYASSCLSVVQVEYQQHGPSDRHSPTPSQPPGNFSHAFGPSQTAEPQVPGSGWIDRSSPQGEERAMRLGEDKSDRVPDTVWDGESGCGGEGATVRESEVETQDLLDRQGSADEDPTHKMDDMPVPPILCVPEGMVVPVPMYESVGKSDSGRGEKECTEESSSPIAQAQGEEESARSRVEESDISQAATSGKQIPLILAKVVVRIFSEIFDKCICVWITSTTCYP